MILAIGFHDDGENYVITDESLRTLSHSARIIDDNLFDIAKIFMSEEERKKEEVLREEKKI